MKVQQKILIIVIALAIVLASLGWIAGTPAARTLAVVWGSSPAAHTHAAIVPSAGAFSLPAITPPGVHPNVSWNG